jgi:hypothetical protein
MNRVLLLDEDPRFIISVQKLFPNGTEWLATTDVIKASELVQHQAFDVIFVRKENEKVLQNLVQTYSMSHSPHDYKPLKKLIILPKYFWKRCIKRMDTGLSD